MREWGRPITASVLRQRLFSAHKGVIYSAEAAECTRLPINVITAHSLHMHIQCIKSYIKFYLMRLLDMGDALMPIK